MDFGARSQLQAPSRPTRIGSLRRFITAAHLQEPLTNCRRRPVHHSLRATERAESRRAQNRGPEEDLLELAARMPANGGLPGPNPSNAGSPRPWHGWLSRKPPKHLRTMAFEAHGARLRRWLTESPLTWKDSPKSLWWERRSRRTPAAGGVAVRPGTARGHAHPTQSVPAPVRDGFAPGRDRKGRALQSLKAPGGGYLSSWSTTRLHGPHVRVPSPKRRTPHDGDGVVFRGHLRASDIRVSASASGRKCGPAAGGQALTAPRDDVSRAMPGAHPLHRLDRRGTPRSGLVPHRDCGSCPAPAWRLRSAPCLQPGPARAPNARG